MAFKYLREEIDRIQSPQPHGIEDGLVGVPGHDDLVSPPGAGKDPCDEAN